MSKQINVLDDMGQLLQQASETQGDWNWKCSCTDCYWNMYHPTKRPDRTDCVSESLADTKMAPNTKECPSYWSYEEACGELKGDEIDD